MRRKTVHFLVHLDNSAFICGVSKGDYSESVAEITCRKCLTVMADEINQVVDDHQQDIDRAAEDGMGEVHPVTPSTAGEIVDNDPFGVDPEIRDLGNPDFVDLVGDLPVKPVAVTPMDRAVAIADKIIQERISGSRKGVRKDAHLKPFVDAAKPAKPVQLSKRTKVHQLDKDHAPNRLSPGVMKRAAQLAKAAPKRKNNKAPKQCACGCKGMTKGGTWLPGHDAKHASNMKKQQQETQKGKGK